jgi:hypothetical protein
VSDDVTHFERGFDHAAGGYTIAVRDRMDKMMTDEWVLAELRSDSRLNAARKEFSAACGRIEQAYAQRKPPSPIEVRRMEFDAVTRIVAAAVVGRPSDFGPAGEVLRGILAPRESKA